MDREPRASRADAEPPRVPRRRARARYLRCPAPVSLLDAGVIGSGLTSPCPVTTGVARSRRPRQGGYVGTFPLQHRLRDLDHAGQANGPCVPPPRRIRGAMNAGCDRVPVRGVISRGSNPPPGDLGSRRRRSTDGLDALDRGERRRDHDRQERTARDTRDHQPSGNSESHDRIAANPLAHPAGSGGRLPGGDPARSASHRLPAR